MKESIFVLFLNLCFICTAYADSCDQNMVNCGVCGETCMYVYNKNTKTLTLKPTGSDGTGVVSTKSKTWDIGEVENMVIEEGITAIKNTGTTYVDKNTGETKVNWSTISRLGSQNGTLTLPSTLKNVEEYAMCAVKFGNVKINATDATFGSYSLMLNQTDTVITMPASNNLSFSANTFYDGNSYNKANKLNFRCLGDVNICQASLGNSLSWYKSAGGYSEVTRGIIYDQQGHLLESCDVNGCTKYTYDQGGNLIRQVDENGHILWQKRIYTVEEATAVVSSKGNTFSIKYR